MSKHHSAHHSSSTTSSDTDDDREFERRKAKSMAKARNRCLPMNFKQSDITSIVMKSRVRIGSSLADVNPMNIDKEVSFEQVLLIYLNIA